MSTKDVYYSGGSDSDIMIDLIERTSAQFSLPAIAYCYFNTGFEKKKITLTDKDGVQFVIEVALFEMIWRNNIGCCIKLYGGGQINVRETMEEIIRKVVS